MRGTADDPFLDWIGALERRHLADLSFAEVRRALQSLSARYVESRRQLSRALDGRGKRAAFALYYAPLHFLILRHVIAGLDGAGSPRRILDLGCGTGASSAAWALACRRRPALTGVDLSPWALAEARWNWKRLGLSGRATRGDVGSSSLPSKGGALLAAYTVNELSPGARAGLKARLREAIDRGVAVLIVEPISRRLTPWWSDWAETLGARSEDWRFPVELPPPLGELDRAAGLDHSTLTARSLWRRGR